MLEPLGPLIDNGSRLTIFIVTVIVSVRLLYRAYAVSQESWAKAAKTLTESADYSRAETERLRSRVAALEANEREHHAKEARWAVEKIELEHRVEVLEQEVDRLQGQADRGPTGS